MERKVIDVIYRQCITLRNGKRVCKPKGQAYRIPIYENDNEPK
jgi:hypothetical protein